MSEGNEQQLTHDKSVPDFISAHVRSVREYEKALYQSALLLNGGGSVALLAFIGTTLSVKLDINVIDALATAVQSFTIGVALAVFSLLYGYASSSMEYFELNKQIKEDSNPKVKLGLISFYKLYNFIKTYAIKYFPRNIIFLLLCSYLLFFVGLFTAIA